MGTAEPAEGKGGLRWNCLRDLMRVGGRNVRGKAGGATIKDVRLLVALDLGAAGKVAVVQTYAIQVPSITFVV